jgi:hypothetical protein
MNFEQASLISVAVSAKHLIALVIVSRLFPAWLEKEYLISRLPTNVAYVLHTLEGPRV